MGRLRLVNRAALARYGAPLAFLAVVTAAVLLVRAGLEGSTSPAPPPTPPAATTTVGRPPPGQSSRRYYRIRPGDTLETIAARFNTTPAVLQALNPGIEPTALRVGQRIRLK